MKILFICDQAQALGGIQRVMWVLVREFETRNIEVAVASLYGRNSKQPLGNPFGRTTETILLKDSWWSTLLQRFLPRRSAARLQFIQHSVARCSVSKLSRETSLDWIIIFDSLAAQILSTAGSLAPKIIFQYHNSFGSLIGNRDFDRIKSISARVAAFLALTEGDAELFARAGFFSRGYLRNPLPFQPSMDNRTRRKTVVAIGRLHRQKDFSTLLKAWTHLRGHDSWNLQIYGDGPDRQALLQEIEELGLGARVTLGDVVMDVEALFLSASLYALSSRYEGLPMVLLEAMACGLPIVATDCSLGVSELLTDYGNNLVPTEDPISFAAELSRVMDNHELRDHMAGRGLEICQRYRKEKVVDDWISFMERPRHD